jgi:hypothetical protein
MHEIRVEMIRVSALSKKLSRPDPKVHRGAAIEVYKRSYRIERGEGKRVRPRATGCDWSGKERRGERRREEIKNNSSAIWCASVPASVLVTSSSRVAVVRIGKRGGI